MDFYVFDTYVKAKDGHIMHFDVVTDTNNLEKVEWTPVFSTAFCIFLHNITFIYVCTPMIQETHLVSHNLVMNES